MKGTNPVPLFLFMLFLQPGEGPLAPAWSPDHEVLATTTAPQRFVTPEGANYTLLLNGQVVYPKPQKPGWHPFSAYTNQHTFLSELEWSPDSRDVAFLEKIYNWEYGDERGRDFDGWASEKHCYVAIVSRAGEARGYLLDRSPAMPKLDWLGNSKIALNSQIFDLKANPPKPIK